MKHKTQPIYIVLGGILALIIVMGIGRFAYTPILPLMQKSLDLSDVFVGYLASSNYLGYLLGALLAGILSWKTDKSNKLKVYLIINIAATMLMGTTDVGWIWFLLRFISGLTSGLVFVLASSIVLDTLARHERLSWSGLFYSGVGFGILVTGIMVPFLNERYGWQGTWIGLGVGAIFIGVIVMLWLQESSLVLTPSEDNQNNKQQPRKKSPGLRWLIASYGCEGVGYIVSGTFIVAIVHQISSFMDSSISWVLVGAAAIPSCVVWAIVAKHWGNIKTLQVLFMIQVIGVLLPAVAANTFGVVLASILFGATFMGITTLFVSEARQLNPYASNRVIGYLTFAYGIGQMIGPSVAGVLIHYSGNYHSSLLFAACVLLVGMMFLMIYQKRRDSSTVAM